LNSVCSTPHHQLYIVHSYKPRTLIDFLSMSPHFKLSNSTECFVRRVYNLHVKIKKKQIQKSNAQYKFQANLYKHHNVLNVGDYFVI